MKSFAARLWLLVLCGAGLLQAQPDPFYVTKGNISQPPQINALVWTNRDAFNVDTFPAPFETQNTVRYVNMGTLQAFPGFRFETVTDSGRRVGAAEWINSGIVTASGSSHSSALGGATGDPFHELFGGLLSIWATNVTSSGRITGSYAGDISIRGNTVNLRRGGIGNELIDGTSFEVWGGHGVDTGDSLPVLTGYVVTQTDFMPEIGFQDIWWRYGETGIGFGALAGNLSTNQLTIAGETPAIIGGGRAGFDVTTVTGDGRGGTFPFGPIRTFVKKVQVETNFQVFDIAFVRVADTNVMVDVSWIPGFDPALPVGDAFIRISAIETNTVLGTPATNQIIFVDTAATQRLETLLRNVVTLNTFSPTNLFAVRASGMDPFTPIGEPTNSIFFAGGTTNSLTHWIDDQVFTNYMQMTNRASTNGYATWAGTIDYLPSRPIGKATGSGFFLGLTGLQNNQNTALSGADTLIGSAAWTNLAGRVRIDADNLDLSRSRIQGQGTVTIKSTNLISSDRLVVDAPFLSLDLSSANNNLNVENFATGTSSHLGGTFRMFSTVISNSFSFTFTNTTDDGNGNVTEATEDVVYNAVFHVTVLDTTFQTVRPQVVEDLVLSSAVVSVNDPLNVERNLKVSAETLNVADRLTRTSGLSIDDSALVGLKNLNVRSGGLLSTDNMIELGVNAPSLETVTSEFGSSIEATSVELRSQKFDLGGELIAAGGWLTLRGDEIKAFGGTLSAFYGVDLKGRNVIVENSAIDCWYGSIQLDAEGLGGTGLEIFASREFHLKSLPALGGLAGSAITFLPWDFEESVLSWPGTDLGATASGYASTSALGGLVLQKGGDIPQRMGRLAAVRITGSGTNNAIYIGRLTLSDEVVADLEDYLLVDPNITVYFGSVSDNLAPTVLDGFITANGGKLVYLPDETASGSIPLKVTVSGDGNSVRLSWDAAPLGSYRVEGRALNGGTWTAVGEVRNSEAKASKLSLEDSIKGASGRLYRVVRGN